MPWTETTRRDYERTSRPRTTDLRDVLDAFRYMAATGCQWAMLPKDFPPPSTVRYLYAWRDSGLLRTINNHLVMAARELEDRKASQSAGMIDSQSVENHRKRQRPRL